MVRTLNLGEMTWPEIEKALSDGYRCVIIPVASIEQHGYHLPENTDTVLGEALAMELAEMLGDALVAPSIRPGVSPHHMKKPGTVTLRVETLRMIVEDYMDCYLSHGFREIVLLISHGGNVEPCKKIVEDIKERHPEETFIIAADVPSQKELRIMEQERHLPLGTNGGHADERETSQMLSLVPGNVFMEKAQCGYCKPLNQEQLNRFFTEGVTMLSENGCIGDPRPATVEAGLWYRRRAAEHLYSMINRQRKTGGLEK